MNDRAERVGVQREEERPQERTLRDPSSKVSKLPSKCGHKGRMRAGREQSLRHPGPKGRK